MIFKRNEVMEFASRLNGGSLTPAGEEHRVGTSSLTEDELKLLATWNATAQEYRTNACVPQLEAMQATATPNALALSASNQILSYHELNRRANQLAHYLQSLGVGPDTLVGVCIGRSLDMAVGLLGVLKAGGAYVPLDPTYPAERLAFMMKDSAAPILVTHQRVAKQLPGQGLRLICLDADSPEL